MGKFEPYFFMNRQVDESDFFFLGETHSQKVPRSFFDQSVVFEDLQPSKNALANNKI